MPVRTDAVFGSGTDASDEPVLEFKVELSKAASLFWILVAVRTPSMMLWNLVALVSREALPETTRLGLERRNLLPSRWRTLITLLKG